MEKELVATSTDVVRLSDEVFGATVKETAPLPLPVVAPTVAQEAPVPAVHEQPFPAVTVTWPDPPAAGKVWVFTVAEYVHDPLIENGFDQSLAAEPDGPTATTCAVYVTRGTSGVASTEASPT